MPVIDVRMQRLHYEDTGGGGLPLVLSHGFLEDLEMFAPQVAALRGRHRMITWDQRGHGKTQATADSFTYWDSADDLAGLLDCLKVERAVIGGMSQGGFISIRFALAYPERTAALVLIDSQSGCENPEKLAQYDMMHDVWTSSGPSDQLLEMVAAIIVGNRAPQSAEWIRKWKAMDPAGLTPIYRTLVDRDDVTARLSEIKVPVLVIHGTDDVAIDLSIAEDMCSRLPDCRLVKIEGAGHSSNLTHPQPANAAIEEFLASL
jgi:pimeloyl-ACP methyl ester carboxylesterase